MKPNFQRERSYFKMERDKSNDTLAQRKLSNSQNKSIEKLSALNLDIEKLYKKYAEIKKERLLKEKSQRILVNRIKVLRSQQNSSKNKEKVGNLKRFENYQKIQVKVNSKYNNKRNILKRYKKHKGNKIDSDARSGKYKTINNNNIKESRINTVTMNTNSNNKSDHKLDSETYNINSIDDFLKKYKYNIGNKNSNNNIYIIINNPNNNFPEKKNSDSNSEKHYNHRTAIYKKENKNKINDFGKEDMEKKHFNSDLNLDFDSNGEKIILMNTDGRKIEDIINSINNIKIEKTDNNIIITNNNENNDNQTKNLEKKNNKQNESIIKDYNSSNKKNNDLKDNKDNNENKDDYIKIDDNIGSRNNDKDKDNKNNLNKSQKIKENIYNKFNTMLMNESSGKKKDEDINNEFFEKKDENNSAKNLKNNNDMIITGNKTTEQFTRPNFLDLYKNEEKADTNKEDIKEEEKNDINSLKNNENKNSHKPPKKDNNSNNEGNEHEHISLDLPSINDSSISNKKLIRKKVIIQNNKNSTINNPKKISSNDDNNSDIYSNQKKMEEMFNRTNNNNFNKFNINNTNNTIPINSSENNKDNKIVNTNDRINKKTIIDNIIYSPKIIEKGNTTQINKKTGKALTNNQRTKNYPTLKRINNMQAKNHSNSNYNNLINYSLSFTNLSCKNNKKTSTSKNNYNTRRNINYEKLKKNNVRKDSYCSTIEKKRKALGLQFKPNFEKELSIQYDTVTHTNNVFGKYKNFDVFKKAYDNSKNKVIKVNKRDEGSINNEEMNITPQRFRIFKKSGDIKNQHVFVKNKTSSNFNYIKKRMNGDTINNNKSGIKINNNMKKNNMNSNYSLSEMSDSLVHINDNNNNLLSNKTINNNN